MWCLWSFLLGVGFLESIFGVIGCLCPTPLGQACWRCLVACCALSTGCSPDNLCLGRGCPASVVRALLVGGLCGGCGPLTFVVGLWWEPVDVWCLYGVGWCFLSLWMWNDVWAAPSDIPP